MGHEITATDSLFTVRKPAWHGLGAVLDDYPDNWDDARAAAGLDWDVQEQPVFVESKVDDDGHTALIPAGDHKAIVRDDNGSVLSIMSNTYTPYPNADLGPLLEALLDDDEVRYETAGSLKGGRKVWVLLRLSEPFEVPGDPHGATMPRLAIQNSHDGSGSLRAQRLQTRIVCDNTSRAADREAARHGMEYTWRHTKNMADHVDHAKQALAGLRSDRDAYREWAKDLLQVRVTPAQRELFVTEFIPEPTGQVVSDRVMANIEDARAAVRAVLSSPTCVDTQHTAYGLVQAGIEYGQHIRTARTQETRFTRTYLSTDRLTSQVEKIAREVAMA